MKNKKFLLLIVLFIGLNILLLIKEGEKRVASVRDINNSVTTEKDYVLPYSGMLPDHPFYKIKVLRDKIMEKLVFNSVKKIEYDLLMADKLIFSSYLLAKKGEASLSSETALKGENYYTQLITDYKWTFWFHKEIPPQLDNKIKIASLKHQKLFKEMIKISKGNEKTLLMLIDFSKRNYNEIEKLKTSD